MEKISAVYQIINEVTGDRYVGSSKNVFHRWSEHKCPSTWKNHPNNLMYQDFQKCGLENFRFQILAPVMPEYLKQVEQEFIEMLKPTYNDRRSEGWDVERYKEHQRKWRQSDKGKEADRKYRQSEKGKEVNIKATMKYNQSLKGKEYRRKYNQSERYKDIKRKYSHQLCLYNSEELTLDALRTRFRKAGIEHPTLEAKKYLIKEER